VPLFRRTNRAEVNKPAKADQDELSQKVVEADSYSMYKLITQLRDVSQTREYKYAEYDIMSADVIIKAALNMYADDSTQVDENSGKIFSVVSSDDTLKKDLESFLKKIRLEDKARDVAYALGKYGNKYWKIYTNKNGTDIDHIEEIDDPGTVLDLWYQGEPVYFAENRDDLTIYKGNRDFNLYDRNSFVHFYVHSGDESDVIELVDNVHFDSNGDPIILKYKLLEGESLIEAVRVVWRILRALEDSLLAARLAKADFVRVFNIEVGQATKTDARLIVNKVKKLFDSSVSMNIRNGTYNAEKSPRAWADPIFNSVSNGKGSIDIKNIGGDFEVKNLIDLDYFNNQLFAGLRIPKTLMGFEESINGGLSNESTLVQLDIRYGKYIKKVIDAEVRGITDLCNIWLKLHKRDYQIGKFSIVYNAPSTTEELAKIQELYQRVQVVAQLVDTIAGQSDGINRVNLIYELIQQFVPYQVFIERIEPILKEAVDDSKLDIKIQKKLKEKQLQEIDNPNFNPFSVNEVDDGIDTDTFDDRTAIGANRVNSKVPSGSQDMDQLLTDLISESLKRRNG